MGVEIMASRCGIVSGRVKNGYGDIERERVGTLRILCFAYAYGFVKSITRVAVGGPTGEAPRS
jgi:hypothetical protein